MLLVVLACASAPHGPGDSSTGTDSGDSGVPDDTADTSDTSDTSDASDTDDTSATGRVTAFSVTLGEPGSLVWASWSADGPTDDTSVAYRFDGGEWLHTPARDPGAGDQRQVVLGLPAATDVEVRLTGTSNGEAWETEALAITTGAAPDDLPSPKSVTYDAALASPEGWVIGSIDVSPGAWWDGPFYFFILDREGRYVWWRKFEDRRVNFPQVGVTGGYIVVEATSTFDLGAASTVHRFALDGEQKEEIPVPGMVWSFSEGADGTLYYDADDAHAGPSLVERAPDGTTRTLWSCQAEYGHQCASNTVKYSADRDTVLWSMYDMGTVVEVDRASGVVVNQWGEQPGSWAFEDEGVGFLDQHWPNFTPDGTLLVSTHLPDAPDQQRALEFELDESGQSLRLVWSYGEGVDQYAYYAGDAHRVSNGNTLVNYGTSGAFREVTPGGEVAFEVDWQYVYLLGHNELVGDLYALLDLPARSR